MSMKTVIMYEISEEIRIFSNKKKAYQFAKTYGYGKSYNHFCTLLKGGFGEFFKSPVDKKLSLSHSINQKTVE
jgi:hypothetical protein